MNEQKISSDTQLRSYSQKVFSNEKEEKVFNKKSKDIGMKRSFFPVMGHTITIFGALVFYAKATIPTCTKNAPPNTECLLVTFHNQSMTLLPPPPPNRKHLKSLSVHEYTMAGKIEVSPVYNYPNVGQASSIELHDMGVTTIRFDLESNPLGFYTVQAKGTFIMKIAPYTRASWKCQTEELALKTPSNPKERINYEVNVKIPYFLEGGVCNYAGPNNYLCTCDYNVAPSLTNLN